MFSQTGNDVQPRRNEGSDKPSATIEPHRTGLTLEVIVLEVSYSYYCHGIQRSIQKYEQFFIYGATYVVTCCYLFLYAPECRSRCCVNVLY